MPDGASSWPWAKRNCCALPWLPHLKAKGWAAACYAALVLAALAVLCVRFVFATVLPAACSILP